jgi:hypothetical protein
LAFIDCSLSLWTYSLTIDGPKIRRQAKMGCCSSTEKLVHSLQ